MDVNNFHWYVETRYSTSFGKSDTYCTGPMTWENALEQLKAYIANDEDNNSQSYLVGLPKK